MAYFVKCQLSLNFRICDPIILKLVWTPVCIMLYLPSSCVVLLVVNTMIVSRILVTRLMSPNTVSVVSDPGDVLDDDDDDRDGDMVTVGSDPEDVLDDLNDGDMVTVGSDGTVTELDNETISGIFLVEEVVVAGVSLTSSLSRNNKHVYHKLNYSLCKCVIA